jgi:malate dehydrogenase (oxaloacetate-decarboxylating)
VGTNRQELLGDPHYLGLAEKRLQDQAYFELVDKLVGAVKNTWPKAIIQWEDFTKDVAFDVLSRYRDQLPCFNDDIQGTGAMALAGLIIACRKRGETLAQQTVVVVGAGAGGIGVASTIKAGMLAAGLIEAEVHSRIFVVDAYGLMIDEMTTEHYKQSLAHSKTVYENWPCKEGSIPNLLEVVSNVRPSVLIGLSGAQGIFNEAIITSMADSHSQPIIFPLSNPTANCEATPEEIIKWSHGRAIVATGSPFPDVLYQGKTYPIGQGNNAFIFPGLGLAAVLGECHRISDAMVLESAYALADYIHEFGAEEHIYPPIKDLKKISHFVATRVLVKALEDGSSKRADLIGINVADYVLDHCWQANYLPVKYAG